MINGITGLMNSGKTLYMVYKLFIAFCSGKEIITNFDLNFPHKKINKDFLTYLGEKGIVMNNVALGLDELWVWIDSRTSFRNTATTYFFNQSSKDDTEIYFTAQWNNQIDKRIRENLHKITQCSRVLIIDGKVYTIDEEQRFLPEKYQKHLYIKIVDFKRVSIGLFSEMIPAKPRYIKADIIFPLYDTRQKVLAK